MKLTFEDIINIIVEMEENDWWFREMKLGCDHENAGDRI